MTAMLDIPFDLPRADGYSNPRDPEAGLPLVYGDFLTTGIPDDFGGLTPAICLDQFNLVYAINAKPSGAATPQIYINDVLNPSTIATYNPAHDFEGRGQIATLTFLVNPGLAQVSVRMQGTVTSGGAVITNPISAIVDAFTSVGTWTLDDFHLPTVNQSRRDMQALNDPMYWCFAETRTYRDWLASILKLTFTDFAPAEDGRLALILDRGVTTSLAPRIEEVEINATRDVWGRDGGVTYTLAEENVTNALILYGGHKWTTRQATRPFRMELPAAQKAYGAKRWRKFDLPGLYTIAQAERWRTAFFLRYGFKPRTVRFVVPSLQFAPLMPPSYVPFTSQTRGWSRRLLKVLNSRPDPDREQQEFLCFDVQRGAEDPVVLPVMSPVVVVDQPPEATATPVSAATLPPPTGITLQTGTMQGADGTSLAWIEVTWDAVRHVEVLGYQVRLRTGTIADQRFVSQVADPVTQSPTVRFEAVGGNLPYFVSIATVNQLGQPGSYSAEVPITTARDTAAPPALASLTLTAALKGFQVRWTRPAVADYAYAEIYASPTNNRNTAALVATGQESATASGLLSNTTYYVWALPIDYSENPSPRSAGDAGLNWYPASATAGAPITTAQAQTADYADGSITNLKVVDLSASKLTTGTISSQTVVISNTGGLGGDSIHLSGPSNNLAVFDTNTGLRVRIGNLGGGGTNYGLQVFDAAGTLMWGINGLTVNGVLAGTLTSAVTYVNNAETNLGVDAETVIDTFPAITVIDTARPVLVLYTVEVGSPLLQGGQNYFVRLRKTNIGGAELDGRFLIIENQNTSRSVTLLAIDTTPAASQVYVATIARGAGTGIYLYRRRRGWVQHLAR